METPHPTVAQKRRVFRALHASGYSTAFFFLIATWEIVWGLGLLRRSVTMLAVVALGVDMLGAVYTHYFNYFAHEVADPLANSLDALRMLCLLAYLAFALKSDQQTAARRQAVPVRRPIE
jgi:hypothetical protein